MRYSATSAIHQVAAVGGGQGHATAKVKDEIKAGGREGKCIGHEATGDVRQTRSEMPPSAGTFRVIRSIRASMYQDSKQLPLLTACTRLPHAPHCTRATPGDTVPGRGPVWPRKPGLGGGCGPERGAPRAPGPAAREDP